MLVGVLGVGGGLFGHETVEHLAQRDRRVVGADNRGGPVDDRRLSDASSHSGARCAGVLAAGPFVGVG